MSILITLVCDGPAGPDSHVDRCPRVFTTEAAGVRAIRAAAAHAGWLKIGSRDFSPQCVLAQGGIQ